MKTYLLLLILLFTTAFAQDCKAPETELPGIADELTKGFPEALDTPQKRESLVKDLLFNFLEYYDNEVAKQNQDDFKAKAAATTSEHEFYTVIREWVAGFAEEDGLSSFSSPRELAALGGDDAPFAGVGMTVPGDGSPEPFLTVLAVRPDSPAALAGIKPRDRVLAIDGKDCPSIMNVRGEEGTEVTLTIQSPNEEARDLTLTRVLFESFPLAYQKNYFRLETAPTIGYFFVGPLGFDESDTTNIEILEQLSEHGMVSHQKTLEGLIVDLRHSGAGNSRLVDRFLGHFLSGSPYAFQSGLSTTAAAYVAKQEPDLSALPLVVLVDGNTKETVVWLAAVLQERANTIVIGQPTFATPVGGDIHTLRDGSEFFFPNLTFVVQKGDDPKSDCLPLTDGRVTPDVLVEGDGFAFAFDEDPFVKAALEELAKLKEGD